VDLFLSAAACLDLLALIVVDVVRVVDLEMKTAPGFGVVLTDEAGFGVVLTDEAGTIGKA